MRELLTFASYDIARQGGDHLYDIGGGVIPEMARAFGYELSPPPASEENIRVLIQAAGKSKELQQNIATVQDVLGVTEDAVGLTRKWVIDSGLMEPVERSFLSPEQEVGKLALAVISGGVRNWMQRRAQRLIEFSQQRGVNSALLVGSSRKMKAAEGPDVEEGMSESDYLRTIIAAKLSDIGVTVSTVAADTEVGDEVMVQAASRIREIIEPDAAIAVVSNAGIWLQNTDQLRRAARQILGPDFDRDGSQILAVSDSFPLGTGTEPALTHQNPFSAIGNIPRNALAILLEANA